MLDVFKINTIGPLVLYQAFSPLLFGSNSVKPKFIVVSSNFGQIADMDKAPFPNLSYGTSKAGVNFVVSKINQEDPDIIAFPIQCVFMYRS